MFVSVMQLDSREPAAIERAASLLGSGPEAHAAEIVLRTGGAGPPSAPASRR